MKFKKLIIRKLTTIPIFFWILSLVCFLIPHFLDMPSGGLREFIWFVYIIPAFVFSYYWGIWGGIQTASILIITQIIHELLEQYFQKGDYNHKNYVIIITTSIISSAITLGIGFLANKLKQNEKKLKKTNQELERKNKLLDNLTQIDELTGLYNRRGLVNKVHNYRKENSNSLTFITLFIGLDKFKPINDIYGHQAGDKLLKEATLRLKKNVNEKTILSRVGGDEFVVLLPNEGELECTKVVLQIKNELSKVYIIEGKEIYITSSIGISLISSEDTDIEEQLQQADIAMNYVKKNGKNNFMVFDVSMKKETEKYAYLEYKLRKAIKKDRFSIYYQPQFDAKKELLVGFEALIRWNTDGKVISPMEFIPLAEETGLIIPIGKWVLETVCKQLKKWEESNYFSIPVAVNISSLQFKQPDFVKMMQEILEKTKVNPQLIKLELTESVIIENERDVINKVKQLKELGVSLSIDDFGSGYSSLAYLKNFPIDEIKMDKTFIDEIIHSKKGKLLVQTIIQLGKSLETNVVAEGVETKEQLEFLQRTGCHIIQGYLMGKPMPVSEIEFKFQK